MTVATSPPFTPGVSPSAPPLMQSETLHRSLADQMVCVRCKTSQHVIDETTGAEPNEWHCTFCGTYFWPGHIPEAIGNPRDHRPVSRHIPKLSTPALLGAIGPSREWMSYADIRRIIGPHIEFHTRLHKLVKSGRLERTTVDGARMVRLRVNA